MFYKKPPRRPVRSFLCVSSLAPSHRGQLPPASEPLFSDLRLCDLSETTLLFLDSSVRACCPQTVLGQSTMHPQGPVSLLTGTSAHPLCCLMPEAVISCFPQFYSCLCGRLSLIQMNPSKSRSVLHLRLGMSCQYDKDFNVFLTGIQDTCCPMSPLSQNVAIAISNPIQNIFIAEKINYKSPLLYESISEVCFQHTFIYITNSAILLRLERQQAVSNDDFLNQASSCFLPSTVHPVMSDSL